MSVKLKMVKYTEIIGSVSPLKDPILKKPAQVDCTASNMFLERTLVLQNHYFQKWLGPNSPE